MSLQFEILLFSAQKQCNFHSETSSLDLECLNCCSCLSLQLVGPSISLVAVHLCCSFGLAQLRLMLDFAMKVVQLVLLVQKMLRLHSVGRWQIARWPVYLCLLSCGARSFCPAPGSEQVCDGAIGPRRDR